MGEERRVKVSGLSLEHPDYAGKLRGEKSQANLMIDRGLKSGKLDVVPLGEHDLIRLISRASDALMILRGLR